MTVYLLSTVWTPLLYGVTTSILFLSIYQYLSLHKETTDPWDDALGN